jgi:hypothetical protein
MSFFVDIQEDGPHHFKKQKPLQVLNLQGFFRAHTERDIVFKFSLQFLDLTYPCYKISEERGKVKGDMTTLKI